ncbi:MULTISPECIES: hypothetical protein [unclassified Myroides]|uniref:hypothetical protein n=1 Tax=unclassified Myroides TaxID=2642485 RepID=UPI0015FC6F20|nr:MULTISPECIES: hypothetical protein [unclassified Myroides]MBB1149635.1 hypothetical protein [Myroides sp. NP-2]MDM1407107.1 hypothetical protein [Myroides sp. DF42-4-2]
MNKRFSISFFCFISFFLYTPVLQAQESEDDCSDCPKTEEVNVHQAERDTTKVASDALYLLRDTDGTVYAKKFEEKFKQKYKGKEAFTYEETEKKVGVLERIKQAIVDWINRNFSAKIGEELSNNYYVIFLRVLGFVALGLILYYLGRAFVQKDIYWLFKKKSKGISAVEDLSTEDFKSTDFEQLITDAIQQEQYRLAIRLYYLWLLQRLQVQEKITWAPEKTNADYMYELKDSHDKSQFSYLSYLYNTIWYGEYEINEEEFYKAKKSFDAKLKPSKP